MGTRWLGALRARAKKRRGHGRFLSKEVTQLKFSWKLIWQQCAGQNGAGGSGSSKFDQFAQWQPPFIASCRRSLQMRTPDPIQHLLNHRPSGGARLGVCNSSEQMVCEAHWEETGLRSPRPHGSAWHLKLSVTSPRQFFPTSDCIFKVN